MIFAEQAEAVRQVQSDKPPEAPQAMDEPTPKGEPKPFKRPAGQWDYLKSQGLSDEEAEAKLRTLYGG